MYVYRVAIFCCEGYKIGGGREIEKNSLKIVSENQWKCLETNTPRKERELLLIFNFKTKLNIMINQINRREQTIKFSSGRNKNRSIVHTSEPMRKFLYTEKLFFKTVHINIKSREENELSIEILIR